MAFPPDLASHGHDMFYGCSFHALLTPFVSPAAFIGCSSRSLVWSLATVAMAFVPDASCFLLPFFDSYVVVELLFSILLCFVF